MDNRTSLDKLHTSKPSAQAAPSGIRSVSGGTDLEMAHAVFRPISVNELGLLQKQSETEPGQPSHDDPVGLGWGAWARPLGRLKYYVGKLRIDALRWMDSKLHFTEMGFIKLAIDELYDNDGKPTPMVAIYLTENDTDSTDQAEQPVAIFTRRGIRFLAPVHMEAGGGGSGGGSTQAQQLWDGTGMYFAQMQNDGSGTFNFVAYKASQPFSIGNPEAVLFSSNDILARLKKLEERP